MVVASWVFFIVTTDLAFYKNSSQKCQIYCFIVKNYENLHVFKKKSRKREML